MIIARYNGKNIVAGLTALMLLTASCSEMEELPTPDNQPTDTEEIKIELSVNIPDGMGTRGTPGDQVTSVVDYLYWSVFEVETSPDGSVVESRHIADFEKAAFSAINQTSENIVLTLPKNKKYQVAMMAKYKSSNFTSFYKGILTVDYSAAALEWVGSKNDVFVGHSDVIDTETDFYSSVTLRRPFAQVNWGTSDRDSEIVKCMERKSSIANQGVYEYISNSIYKTLDVLSNEVSSPITKDISYKKSNLNTTDAYTFPSVNGVTNTLFQTLYLLVDQKKSSTVNCKMKFTGGINLEVEVNNAPVMANYRTNIYGALLTDPGVFEIDTHEGFLSPSTNNANVDNKDIIDKIMSGEDVEIPEGVTVDITDYSRPALKDGQTITVNGTLRVNTMQLYISGEGKELNLNGTGMIYCNSTNDSQVIYANNKATVKMKDLTVYSAREGSGTTIYAKNGGNFDLDNITVKTGSWGIVCYGGILNAKDCKVYESGNVNIKGIGVEDGAVGYFSNCEIYSSVHSMYILDSEVTLDNCRFIISYRPGRDDSNVLVEGTSKLTILSGYYKSVGTHTIYRFAKKDDETEESVVFDIRGGHFSRPFGSEKGWVAVNPAPGYKLVSTDDPEFPLEVIPE